MRINNLINKDELKMLHQRTIDVVSSVIAISEICQPVAYISALVRETIDQELEVMDQLLPDYKFLLRLRDEIEKTQ